MKDFNYTDLEKKVMQEIADIINHEGEYIFASDVIERLGIDAKIVRGVLSSLVKKGAIDIDNEEGGLINVFDDTYSKDDNFTDYGDLEDYK